MDSLDDLLNRLANGNRFDAMGAEAAVDSRVSGLIAEITQIAEHSPGEAFGQLVTLTSFFNEAVRLRVSIAEKIAKHVDEVRKALATIAEGLGAESFSMSASLPVGLSVSLTFPVKCGE